MQRDDRLSEAPEETVRPDFDLRRASRPERFVSENLGLEAREVVTHESIDYR